MISGIFSSVAEYKKRCRNSKEYMIYDYGNDNNKFVIYCWNIFSTIIFVQECLKRFGEPNDQFVLKYCKSWQESEVVAEDELGPQFKNKFSFMLIESKNLILRGAPSTGKSYLAKEIAADNISDGKSNDYTSLTDEQKKQVGSVQFHPSLTCDLLVGPRIQLGGYFYLV